MSTTDVELFEQGGKVQDAAPAVLSRWRNPGLWLTILSGYWLVADHHPESATRKSFFILLNVVSPPA